MHCSTCANRQDAGCRHPAMALTYRMAGGVYRMAQGVRRCPEWTAKPKWRPLEGRVR